MKKIAVSLAIAFASVGIIGNAVAGGQIKEVCTDKLNKAGKVIIDKKTGKPTQECKKIKVHKKVEGTKVPEKK